MATYKVIQDIEAEDHIIGPLSLRQFIFAIISILCFYFCYLVLAKNIAFLLVLFLPPALFTGFFAVPFGKDQPTEIWALAKIRFLFKPRRRIWDQSGVKQLVTVTAPKKVEEHRTDGLSQTEVRSRLNALANTIDSRGWAIKNVAVNSFSQPGLLPNDEHSDRLIDVSSMASEVPAFDVQASDDILDVQNNKVAQQFDQMINASSQAHRQQIAAMMAGQTSAPQNTNNGSQQPADYWFLNQSLTPPSVPKGQQMFAAPPVVLAGMDSAQIPATQAAEPTDAEEALAERLKAERNKPEAAYSHLKTIQPLGQQSANPSTVAPPAPQPDPLNAQLAANNDLNIATLSRIANKQDETPDDEVVIALH